MGKEIERKFLVKGNSYRAAASRHKHIIQAYLSADADATVRLRIMDDKAYITVKSRNEGCRRGEWEYEIPADDARQMIEQCHLDDVIEKTRYYIEFDRHTWEVDEFAGRLAGLVVAEIELSSEDDKFAKPEFIGEEVTGDSRYYNSSLLKLSYPF